jgi:hypothetical protein
MIELHSDEKLVKEIRRYWLAITIRAIGFLAVGIFPLVILIGADSYPATVTEALRPYLAHAYLFALIWFLFCWIALSIAWVDYYLDIFIITSKRVIDIEQLRLFSRSFAEMPIENIEDIHVEVHGFLASALDFGNVTIQSAGEKREFCIENVHHPGRIKDVLSLQYDLSHHRRTGVPSPHEGASQKPLEDSH